MSAVQALGIKPRTLRPMAHAKLDKKDVQQLLSRGSEGEEPDPAAEADRIQGLGFAAYAYHPNRNLRTLSSERATSYAL